MARNNRGRMTEWLLCETVQVGEIFTLRVEKSKINLMSLKNRSCTVTDMLIIETTHGRCCYFCKYKAVQM